MPSPYDNRPEADWPAITRDLAAKFPVPMPKLAFAVTESWRLLFDNTLVGGRLRLGVDLFPGPQVIGNFLHELIPLVVADNAPGWRRGTGAAEKDLVFPEDQRLSMEIKTSSSGSGLHGNRSYALAPDDGRKSKDGYYLVVNFPAPVEGVKPGPLTRVRFGWLSHTDWTPQASPSGQRASVESARAAAKLIQIWPPAPPPGPKAKTGK